MSSYTWKPKEGVDKIFYKLSKKNPKQLAIIYKKLGQILEDPYRSKPLRVPMQGMREVHIDKHFVLIYSIDEENKVVIIEDYDHHGNIFD